MTRKDRHFAIGTIVRHFKGRIYRIEGFTRQTETGDLLVIHRQMFPPYYSYAMPEPMFCSEVDKSKYPNAEQQYRFEKLSKKEALTGER